MNDDLFIESYIKKNFEASFKHEALGFKEIKSKLFYPMPEMYKMILTIFGSGVTSHGRLPQDIVRSIGFKFRDIFLAEVNDYLDNHCTIILGPTNWIVINDQSKVFKYEDLLFMFKGRYDGILIKALWNQWYDDTVIKNSEMIMNIY